MEQWARVNDVVDDAFRVKRGADDRAAAPWQINFGAKTMRSTSALSPDWRR
jgi:hypothetical protein